MADPVRLHRRGAAALPQALPQKKVLHIYTVAACSFCQRAKVLLDEHKIAYVEHSLDGDEEQRLLIIQRSGGRTVLPQLFVGERHIGGFFEIKQHCLDDNLPLLLGLR